METTGTLGYRVLCEHIAVTPRLYNPERRLAMILIHQASFLNITSQHSDAAHGHATYTKHIPALFHYYNFSLSYYTINKLAMQSQLT